MSISFAFSRSNRFGNIDITFIIWDGTFTLIEGHAILLNVHVVVATTWANLLPASRSIPIVHTFYTCNCQMLDRGSWHWLLIFSKDRSPSIWLTSAMIEIGGCSFTVVEVLSCSGLGLNLNWCCIQVRKNNTLRTEVACLIHWWPLFLSIRNNEFLVR